MRAAALLLALGLAGCDQGPDRELASCKVDAFRAIPQDAAADTIMHPTPAFGQFVQFCMESKGYSAAGGTCNRLYSACWKAPAGFHF